MPKYTHFLSAVFLVLLSFSSYADKQKIVVGISHYYPPFILDANPNEPLGFDVAFVSMLCSRLNLACQFKVYYFDDLINAVLKNEVSLATGAVTITSRRSTEVLFSTPYLPSQARFLGFGKSDLPSQGVTSFEALTPYLAGKKIGLTKGTVYAQKLNSVIGSKATFKVFRDFQGGIAALNQEKIDLFLTDALSSAYWEMKGPKDFHFYGPAFSVGDGYGVMIGPKAANLQEKINQEILKMQADGSFLALYNEYFSL